MVRSAATPRVSNHEATALLALQQFAAVVFPSASFRGVAQRRTRNLCGKPRGAVEGSPRSGVVDFSPSCPALCRASTSLQRFNKEDVDGRETLVLAIRRRRIAPSGHDEFNNKRSVSLVSFLSQAVRSPRARSSSGHHVSRHVHDLPSRQGAVSRTAPLPAEVMCATDL